MEGHVVNLPTNKGYGFIKNKQGTEYFFHRDDFRGFWNDMIKDFVMGNPIPVVFDIIESPKGHRAHDVVRMDWPNNSTVAK